MAKNFRKFFINNLKESQYLSNIQRVKFDDTKTDGNNIIGDSQIKKRISEIDRYEKNLRHNNLKVYVENMAKFRCKRFFVLVAPFALAVSTVASFIIPYKQEKTKAYDAYQREAIVLDKDRGQIIDNDDFYYYNFWGDLEFVDAEHDHNSSDLSEELRYHIYDGIEEFNANFSYTSDGKLYFNSVDVGKYINFDEYNFSESINVEEKFENLFDDILVMLREECKLDEDQLSILNKLDNSEDKKIIIEIIKYNSIGKKEVKAYGNNFWLRAILLSTSLIYGWILSIYFKRITRGNELYAKDGKLDVNSGQDIGLIHVPLKYKEAFIKAETERIMNARDLAEEYIIPTDRDKIFTNFERRLNR